MLRPQWTSFCCTPEGPFEMQWTSASCRQFGAASSKGHGALFYVQPHAGSGFNGLQQCFPLPYGPGCDFNLKSKPCKTHLILWMRDKMKLGRGALGATAEKEQRPVHQPVHQPVPPLSSAAHRDQPTFFTSLAEG